MSAVIVSMTVLIRTFSSGIGYVKYGTKTCSLVLLNKKIHILLSQVYSVVYGKLLKRPQSLRITLYIGMDKRRFTVVRMGKDVKIVIITRDFLT